jgi:hypothetical protein
MAQRLTSWLICNGGFCVHTIDAVGRRRARIIEVEEVDTGKRIHGSARRLERLVHTLLEAPHSSAGRRPAERRRLGK